VTRIPDSMSLLQTTVKGKVPVHDTKAREGRRSITLPILNFSISWIKVVNFMPLPLYLQYPHGGQTASLNILVKRKISCPFWESNHTFLIVQPFVYSLQ